MESRTKTFRFPGCVKKIKNNKINMNVVLYSQENNFDLNLENGTNVRISAENKKKCSWKENASKSFSFINFLTP